VHEPHGAELAGRDARPRLEDDRVVAVDERDGGDSVRALRRLEQALGLGRRRRERLLADDVLAGLERRLGERRVQVVGRADVDDVDALGDGELLGRGEGALGVKPRRRLARPLRRGRRDAGELGPGQARGARVDGADEAGRSGDRGA
jgi:hypothetical protein